MSAYDIIPFVYILSPDKKESTNTLCLKILNHSNLVFNRFHFDYEKAVMNSIKSEFPETKVQGCFFSFESSNLETCTNMWFIITI